jgi:hypothetical protein
MGASPTFLEKPRLVDRVVDGGHFENFADITASELALAVKRIDPRLPWPVIFDESQSDFESLTRAEIMSMGMLHASAHPEAISATLRRRKKIEIDRTPNSSLVPLSTARPLRIQVLCYCSTSSGSEGGPTGRSMEIANMPFD